MDNYSKLNGYSLLICITLFLIASCNNGGDEKKVAANGGADTISKTIEVKEESSKAMSIAGTLDNLWVTKSDFNKLDKDKKVVFSFTFQPNDTLTLYGWSCKGALGNCNGTYYTNPDIMLKKGISSGVTYGPKVFFGNIILRKNTVKKIVNGFNTYTYVVFVPENNSGFITYKIYVTNDDPTKSIKPFVLEPTLEEANPSPPKDY
ncbi:MAG: hypothetical protein WBC06_17585 [Chitinophagaceae bacterium]